MSWVSDVAGKVYDAVTKDIDSQSDKLIGDANTARRVKKFGRASVAAAGGRIGMQYAYSREKGMNSEEATQNAYTGGAQYGEVRGKQIARENSEEQARRDAEFSRREAEALRLGNKLAAGQIAARVRRRRPADRARNAVETGQALGGTGSGASDFAQLLGL